MFITYCKLLTIKNKYGFFTLLTGVLVFVFFYNKSEAGNPVGMHSALPDPYIETFKDLSVKADTIKPKDRDGDFLNHPNQNPLDLKDPSIIDKKVEYDPVSGKYYITEKIGDQYYRTPTYMTFEEYLQWKSKQQDQQYYDRLLGTSRSGEKRVKDPIDKIDVSKTLIDRLFGGSNVEIKPSGNVDLIFKYNHQYIDNPILLERQRKYGVFDFDMNINMNVTGKIGEKLKLSTSYNSKATFDFDNQIKLQYNTDNFGEDEILKKIELGNVSLPLRSNLIQGSQALFGVKTEVQFGHLRLTGIASQQRSQQKKIQIQNKSQVQNFRVAADEYDENKNFFLSHYNRATFEDNMKNLPQISSLFKITKLEVWVTNDRLNSPNVLTRDIVAIADLGEGDITKFTNPNPNLAPNPAAPRDITGANVLPDNYDNPIYQYIKDNKANSSLDDATRNLNAPPFSMQPSRDYEKVRARLLTPSEYYFDPILGILSLNTALRPDQVLGVAFQYTYNASSNVHSVGEVSSETPQGADSLNVVFVKMLKSTAHRVNLPTWQLMMKNIYSLGAYQVNSEDFKLDVFYQYPGEGEIRFLKAKNVNSEPLIRLMNLDNLNRAGERVPDGVFDFVPNYTIFPSNGRVMFPVLEPFGRSLAHKLNDDGDSTKYVYTELYDSTLTRAREVQEKNRFIIKGQYKSSVSNEYSLGAFNIPQGSIRVTQGGYTLREGIDYDVDYGLGKVRIINDGLLASGAPISISFEDNALFSFQNKAMLGLRADYQVSKNFNIGGTYMHLFERPYTQKVNIGEDPINNRIVGLDVNYSTEVPLITRLVDKIPLISTKEPSKLTVSAEGAALVPGHSKAINQGNDKGGAIYIDDFEGSTSSIDLRTPAQAWVIASVPQNDNNNNNPRFPESSLINDLKLGYNRALLNWYRIETAILNTNTANNSYTRVISQQDIFPNISYNPALNNNIQTFDITYYPQERGPYNFDPPEGSPYSKGLTQDGKLKNPETRWAGIMRSLTNTDFEYANIEYIEFWMLNPFMPKEDGSQVTNDGKIVINLGNVSEDVLRDSRLFFENGLPGINEQSNVDFTKWATIPRTLKLVRAFDSDPNNLKVQDLGLDGLDDDGEKNKFSDYYNLIQNSSLTAEAKSNILSDPANDNFVHFRSPTFNDNTSLFERYRKFNNTQGNSQPSNGTVSESNTNLPDSEDLNQDNSLNETEAYYLYEIPVRKRNNEIDLGAEDSYITDTITAPGRPDEIWYRFKIPIEKFKSSVGGLTDFRSIRFFRMYFTDFDQRVTFRFAKFNLIRNQWRKYTRGLRVGPPNPWPGDAPNFDLNAVNIEENGKKIPFNYVIPPGIIRERFVSTYADLLQNEQSLALTFNKLEQSRAIAIYKILNLDMRVFDRLKMYVHAESPLTLKTGELRLFMRLGSDFTENYYEYDIPLSLSDPSLPADANNIWLEANNIDFALKTLTDLKVQRDNLNIPKTQEYAINDPEKPGSLYKVVGSPNLGLVKNVMVGIYNGSASSLPLQGEVWINELRLNGLNEKGGYAAQARMNLQLADLANVALAGNYASIGWGGIDQRLAQRALDETVGYDVATNVELGKFFPVKSGIRIPFYYQYSNITKTPKYDPYDLDIILKEKLTKITDARERDSIKQQSIDYTSIKSFNFTNVRKDRIGQKKPMPWDIENISVSYKQSDQIKHDPIIELDNLQERGGNLDYNFSRSAKYIKPLKKLFKNDKYLKFLTEFNFNPLPNSVGFSNVLLRQRSERLYRFSLPDYGKSVSKNFTWDRLYNLNWDLTESLKFRYSATNHSVIDENPEVDPTTGKIIYWDNEQKRQAKEKIWDNIQKFGRTKDFTQNINVTYNVPLKNFPFLDFVQVNATFNATFKWNAAYLNADSLGNVIQNTQLRQIGSDFNFERLYSKWKYLDKINKGSAWKPAPGAGGKGGPGATGPGSQMRSRLGQAQQQSSSDSGNDPNNPDNKDAKDSKSSSKKGKNKDGSGSGKGDPKDKSKKDDKKDSKAEYMPSLAERILIRPLMSIRKGQFNYTENLGSVVPGYMPRTDHFGMSPDWSAPGLPYILGFEPNSEFYRKGSDSWISGNVFLNQELTKTYSQKIDARLTLEPYRDIIIELNLNKTYTKNHSEFFKDTLLDGVRNVQVNQPRDFGSYTISYLPIKTLFEKDINKLFDKFEENRAVISHRLGTGYHVDDSSYTQGYGRTQQDVLIPSFISAYSGKDPSSVGLNALKTVPNINWSLTYNGLQKLPMFKDIFTSISLKHAYVSTLTVNNFSTNMLYSRLSPYSLNINTQNYYSSFEIPNIVIVEQFSPLIGIDVRTKNDLNVKFEIRKSRNLDMSFLVNQLNESKRTDYVFGFGYKMKGVRLKFLEFGQEKTKAKTKAKTKSKSTIPQPTGTSADKPKSLDLFVDVSLSDDITLAHLLDQKENPQPTRGSNTLRINPRVEYEVNKFVQLQVFYDYNRTSPKVLTSYKTINHSGGIRIRISLN